MKAGWKIPGSSTPPDSSPLTTTEAGDILFMREEEQLAYDLYTRWYGMYSIPVFSNIAASETMHVNEVRCFIGRRLQGDRIGNATTGYHNATIQSLYNSLTPQGDADLTGALEASLAVEERDIADLDHALAGTTRADIIQIYSNLRRGSENHRSAFLRQPGRVKVPVAFFLQIFLRVFYYNYTQRTVCFVTVQGAGLQVIDIHYLR